MSDYWTEQNRYLLVGILDQLIPANPEKGIPSAGAFGVGDFIAARAAQDDAISGALNELFSNTASMNSLSSAASIDGNVSVELVRQLEAKCAKSFSVLVRLTYMGYYSQPEIRSLVGVGSWPVHPNGYEVPIESADLLDKLTAPVTKRGQAYREFKSEQARSPTE